MEDKKDRCEEGERGCGSDCKCKGECEIEYEYETDGDNPKLWYQWNDVLGREEWIVDDKLHRLDGPAYIEYYENGNPSMKEWKIHGVLHRLSGPAYIEYYENGNVHVEEWYVNGKKHKIDGPAWLYYGLHGIDNFEWYIDGEPICDWDVEEVISQKIDEMLDHVECNGLVFDNNLVEVIVGYLLPAE